MYTVQQELPSTMDHIKALGYKYSTRAAMTVSISDMTVPAAKKDILADAEKTVETDYTQLPPWSSDGGGALQSSC